MGKRLEPGFSIAPERHFAAGYDRPGAIVAAGVLAIGGGRHGMAGRVRMVVAQHRRPAAARRAVRREQRGGIDLEAQVRVWRDVVGRHRRRYPAVLPQQQAAALFGRGLRGPCNQRCDNFTCDQKIHSHLLAVVTGESIIEGVIDADGLRLDKALAEASGLSRERIKALLGEGRIALAGKPAGPASLKTVSGTPFAIHVPQAIPAEAAAQDIPLTVVFEDEHLIVVDKPAGLVVHPAAGNLDGTLVNALLHHCRGQLSGIGGVARPGIVHRIDKDTSGLLVVAKTDTAHEGLARQFADHSIERAYRAVVAGHPMPPAGTVRGAIARSATNRKKMALVEEGRGKHAVTHYRTLERLRDAALVECRLETGRTHQVRVHMSSIGHMLLGDPVYGRSPPRLRPVLSALSFERQALHAAELGLVHPVNGKTLRFVSEMPEDMITLIGELRN
jgi:23S rRNA pseudouridine1911/1915/1917 synthase